MGVFLRQLAWLSISGALLSTNKLRLPLSEKLSTLLSAEVFWPSLSYPSSKQAPAGKQNLQFVSEELVLY